jgi:ribonuclease P protein component
MPSFVLLVRPREDDDPTMRVGFTVTRKIGNAVVRNRMKRRFRALSREILPNHGVPGADHVLIGRAGGVERDYASLGAELKRALKKVAAA